MAPLGSGKRVRQALDELAAENERWRKQHTAQVYIVERVLPATRFVVLGALALVFSPVLIVVWTFHWLVTGETWPLKGYP